MDGGTCHKANSDTQLRKRKRKHKGIDDAVGVNKLPDDVIIAILSRISPKEAARTSVLSRRWRYLWFSSSGTLKFDDKDMFSSHDRDIFLSGAPKFNHRVVDTRVEFMRKKFIAWVNRVLKLHQGRGLDGLIIRFSHLRLPSPFGRRPSYIDNWIYFAMQKEVKMLELNFARRGGFRSHYGFPNVDMLLSRGHDINKFGFGSLRSLRLVGIDIKDEVVQYFLASCPYLEQLCIRASSFTEKLQVVDPLPSLKVLEISDCHFICSLEVSAMNIVSCTYQGSEIILPFKKTPNLSELTLGGRFAQSFIYEPCKHSSYSVQLVKLALDIQWARFDRLGVGYIPTDLPQLCSLKHLELNVRTPVAEIYFFISLIKASPLLNEFRIKISYMRASRWDTGIGFPDVHPDTKLYRCRHKNLKTVKMSGYVGSSGDEKFILCLLKVAPKLEEVTIDTESEYYEREPWDCCPKPSEYTGGGKYQD